MLYGKYEFDASGALFWEVDYIATYNASVWDNNSFVIGHTQNSAKYIDLFDRILHACDLDMIFWLKGLKNIIKKSCADVWKSIFKRYSYGKSGSAKSGDKHKRLDAQIYDRDYDYESHKKHFMIFRKNLKIFRRV